MNIYKKMSSEVETVVKKVKKLPGIPVESVNEVQIREEVIHKKIKKLTDILAEPIKEVQVREEVIHEEKKAVVEWSVEDEQEYRKLYLNLFTKKRSKIDLSLSGLHDIRLQLQGSQYEDIEIDELYQIVKIFKTTEELDDFLMKIWNFDK